MINRLDFWLFGNGHGMAAPYSSQGFYWLVDTLSGRGRMYTWIGGLGAQLQSFEWLTPKPGTCRRIKGRDFRPFNARRNGLRVRVSWATSLPHDLDEQHAAIRSLKADLTSYSVLR